MMRVRCKFYYIYIVIISLLIINNSAIAAVIKGKVLNKKSEPVAFVNVFIKDSGEGSMSDIDGSFLIKTKITGNCILKFSHIKYEKKELPLTIPLDSTISLNITLEESFVQLDAVTVTAGSFTAADEEGKTLNSMDVVTTAGAAADILKAIQTFPGVTQVDEGAGMYVRGGDVSETVMLLDGATLVHPYRYESDTGGFFGLLNPFCLKGTYFSSGAFSAKYGNALSGVLAMESLDIPERKTMEFGAGLAALSLGVNYPVIDEKLGVRLVGNYSNTEALFRLNGGAEEFNKFPVSWDENLNVVYKFSNRGQLKYFNYSTRDAINFIFNSPSYTGPSISSNENYLNNVQIRQLLGEKIIMKSSLSHNAFKQDFEMGNLKSNNDDEFMKWRTDFVYSISNKLTLNSGFELDKTQNNISGSYPEDENDLNPDANSYDYETNYENSHQGIYFEGEYNFSAKLFTISGIRLDKSNVVDDLLIDPRISFGYRLNDENMLKLAGGIYHQFPKSQYTDGYFGNSDLLPMKAIHYVAGYEYKNEIMNIKAEIYYKDYDNLPLQNVTKYYDNNGYGYAYGADFFLKGNLPFISGWISYSYLSAERKELEHLKLVPTYYDIRHNFVAALKKMIFGNNMVSLTYRFTSGKPYTAALNEWNAKRLPPIQRLDISWSYYRSFQGENFIVYYAAISNLLDRENIYGYIYNSDYSQRTELKSTYGRNIYFGLTLSLGKFPKF